MEQKTVNSIVSWIKEYFQKNSFAKGVVIGMSGGKDSLIVAKLCVLALGKEHVFGVIMPNNEMIDKSDAEKICELLGISYSIINIHEPYTAIIKSVNEVLKENNVIMNSVTTINTAPRLRMTTLYALAGSLGYLVANTSNLSESSVGYTTKWGDNVGDFAPITNFTKTEVCELGLLLGLPKEFVEKTPSDGLSGTSDEEKMGFKYASLDHYIRTGEKVDNLDKILRMHAASEHKRTGAIKFDSRLKNVFEEKKEK